MRKKRRSARSSIPGTQAPLGAPGTVAIDAGSLAGARLGIDYLLRLDRQALVGLRRLQAPRVRRAMAALTRIGNTPSWFVHVPLVLLLPLADPTRAFTLMAAGALGALAVSQLLKRVARRPRPDCSIEGFAAVLENPDAFSFPSGHSAVAFGAAVAVVGASPALGAAELSLASAIAFSRVYLGAHYPFDVAAGMLIGIACGRAAAAACGAFF